MKKKMSRALAQPPGTLIHIGEKRSESVGLGLTRYNEQDIQESNVTDISPGKLKKSSGFNTWLNIIGLHDVAPIEQIGKNFDIHPLVLEDILNTTHRPKQEDLEKYLFVVLKMLTFDPETKSIKSEQISIILLEGFLLTFQELMGDVFEPVRERLRQGRGRIRKSGTDYLFYALIDAIVDNYFLVLENLGEEIENLEDSLISNPTKEAMQTLHKLKQEMIFFRKAVWPLRDMIRGLSKTESSLINKETEVFIRDIYDHVIHITEAIETYRDMLTGLQDLYLSSVSNKMNEVMKVLTIMATIFIPLTFIAGVYGMNFDFMPELRWRYGYFIIWGIMVLSGFVMFVFFKRKKWL